jgi:hypothetical protein
MELAQQRRSESRQGLASIVSSGESTCRHLGQVDSGGIPPSRRAQDSMTRFAALAGVVAFS